MSSALNEPHLALHNYFIAISATSRASPLTIGSGNAINVLPRGLSLLWSLSRLCVQFYHQPHATAPHHNHTIPSSSLFTFSPCCLNRMANITIWYSRTWSRPPTCIHLHTTTIRPRPAVRQKELYLRFLQQVFFRYCAQLLAIKTAINSEL